MAKRLAKSGYAILVVNPSYLDTRAPVLAQGASLRDQEALRKAYQCAGLNADFETRRRGMDSALWAHRHTSIYRRRMYEIACSTFHRHLI